MIVYCRLLNIQVSQFLTYYISIFDEFEIRKNLAWKSISRVLSGDHNQTKHRDETFYNGCTWWGLGKQDTSEETSFALWFDQQEKDFEQETKEVEENEKT